jgi:enoyl-CoA hydratase/carnithine racemase
MPTKITHNQGWIMGSFFNYSTLDVDLVKSTRTLVIALNSPESKNAINLELLFELESILAWATGRIEIHTILIKSKQGKLSPGIDTDMLNMMKESMLQKLTHKLQKITHALFHLPQTIIVDLGDGANNLACELAVGADIRIASDSCKMAFDHTNHGLIPCSGGMGILSEVVGNTFAKNWILMGSTIPMNQLLQSGFLYSTYNSNNREQCTQQILSQIHKQAPVQRVQAKLGLFEGIKDAVENATVFEKQIGKAARIAQDWKEKEPEQRMPAKNMSKAVKLSLVKGKDSQDPLN